MITCGKSFSNCKVIALDPILKPVLNVKDIDLHFLTYFADTSFYLLVIKNYLLHIMCGYQCDKAVNKSDTREVI